MFDRTRSAAVAAGTSKGLYWAARPQCPHAGQPMVTMYFSAGRCLSGAVLRPARARATRPFRSGSGAVADLRGQSCAADDSTRRLVQAMRFSASKDKRSEQTLVVRALAESLNNDAERVLATQFGQQIGRADVGVWVARMARVKGSAFYVETAYPRLPAAVNGARMWSLAHGIARQESSFDRAAISHAGARGMMQLMPGTAREQAGKLGMGYDPRGLRDPVFNVTLGTAIPPLNIWRQCAVAVAATRRVTEMPERVNRLGDPRRGKTCCIHRANPVSERGLRPGARDTCFDRMNPISPRELLRSIAWESRPAKSLHEQPKPRSYRAGFACLSAPI